jgi:membrane protease YdiL (CAAX protease family)
MIKADYLSKMLTIVAVMLLLYLTTFDLGVILIFPVVLLTAGILLQFYNFGKPSEVPMQQTFAEGNMKSFSYYILLGAAMLFVVGLVTPAIDKLPFLANVSLTIEQAVMYSVLIAIAEEQFFRGFLTNFLSKYSMLFGIFGSAAIFAVFHLAVYGSSVSALFYVLSAGLLLAWLGIRSGKLSVTMVVHIINNLGALI